MIITLEYIKRSEEQIRLQREQMLANVSQCDGALQMLASMRAYLGQPEPGAQVPAGQPKQKKQVKPE